MNPAGFPTIRLLRMLSPYWGRLTLAIAAAVIAELAAVALMATAAWLISRAAQQPPLTALAVAIVAVRGLALSRGVFRYIDRLLGHDAVLAALAGLRARVYAALVPLVPGGLPGLRSGRLLRNVVDDVDAAQDLLLRCVVPGVVAGTVGAGAVAVTSVLLPPAGALLAVGLLVAGLVIPIATMAVHRRAGNRLGTVRDELATRALDLTEGAAELSAFGASAAVLGEADKANAEVNALERRASLTTGLASAGTLLVQGLTTLGVTLLALDAAAAGSLPVVLLAVVTLTALTTFEVTGPLPEAAERYVEVRASARRLIELVDAEAPVTEPAEPAEPAGPLAGPRSPVTVRLRAVRARYRPDDGTRPPALDGVDLDLHSGRRLALIGPSGSGKSTVVAVLMRLLEYDGLATINGAPLRDCHGDDVRSLITGMTQEAHVFHATIRDNVALARPDADQDQLDDAARQARLLTWIESLPDGWDTVVGGDGRALSGGQRQRVLLTRALLADPPVLVLDEPTEGLDPDTAEAVLADILDATRGRTTLLVTHSLAGLSAVDEVAVMDGGRVIQRGNHDELSSVPGHYRDLYCAHQLAAVPA